MLARPTLPAPRRILLAEPSIRSDVRTLCLHSTWGCPHIPAEPPRAKEHPRLLIPPSTTQSTTHLTRLWPVCSHSLGITPFPSRSRAASHTAGAL